MEKNKSAVLGFRCAEEEREEVFRICAEQDRRPAFVTYRLFLRGLAAFKRDGLLAEPEETTMRVVREGVRANMATKRKKKMA